MYRHGINSVVRKQCASVTCLRAFERHVSRASAVTKGLVAERRSPTRPARASGDGDERRPSAVALSNRSRERPDRDAPRGRPFERRDDSDGAPLRERSRAFAPEGGRDRRGTAGRESSDRPAFNRDDRPNSDRRFTRSARDDEEPRYRAPRSQIDRDDEPRREDGRRASSIVPERRRFSNERESRPQQYDSPREDRRDSRFPSDRSYGEKRDMRSRDSPEDRFERRERPDRAFSDRRPDRRVRDSNSAEGDRRGFERRSSEGRDFRKPAYDSPRRSERAAEDFGEERPRFEKRDGALGFSRDDFAKPRRVQEERPRSRVAQYGNVDNDPPPGGIPFSSAESEFIYGANSVLAALKAKRRKSFALYLHPDCRESEELKNLAKEASVKVTHVGNNWKPYMEKRTEGRPHNGVLLEASPLPIATLESLAKAKFDSSNFETIPAGSQIEHISARKRPLVLCLTDILDPQNLGSVLRTAYFLGIDAVVIDKRTCAPLGATALKASAGAAEALPIFFTNNATKFLGNSRKFAWKVFAAHTPALKPPKDQQAPSSSSICDIVLHRTSHKGVRLTGEELVVESPVILVVGGEGKGLVGGILGQTHGFMHIKSGRDTHAIGLDSLNVGVATAICCTDLLGRSAQVGNKVSSREGVSEEKEDTETADDLTESAESEEKSV